MRQPAPRLRLPLLACLALALAGCATQTARSPEQPPAAPDPAADLRLLADWMTGSFDSADQAGRSPEQFYHIDLHICRIWPDQPDGVWLYVEQASALEPDRPYRQRVYQLAALADGSIECNVFSLPDAAAHVGAWRESAPLTGLTPLDLLPRTGCALFLRRNEVGEFVGGTMGTACPSELRGAAYATSQMWITLQELRTWDRGFDRAGRQVWGATAGPYEFRRRSPAATSTGD